MSTIKGLFRKYFHKPVEIRRSWIDTPGEFHDLTKFLSWFDRTESVQETQKRSESDWAHKITAFPQYPKLARETCLEIGFGGGRLLVEASKEFKRAIGVDIHAAFDKTQTYIDLHHRDNITLLHKDQLAMLPNKSSGVRS